jgi:hypothetical protein
MPVSHTMRPKVTMGVYPGLAPRIWMRLISAYGSNGGSCPARVPALSATQQGHSVQG